MHDISEGLLEMRRLLTDAEVAARTPGQYPERIIKYLAQICAIAGETLTCAMAEHQDRVVEQIKEAVRRAQGGTHAGHR